MPPLDLMSRQAVLITAPDDISYATPIAARIGYMLAALLGIGLTTSLFTIRVRTMRQITTFSRLKPLHFMQLAVYILGIMFETSAAITTFGVGLSGSLECQAAIILCLVFYLGQKFLLYLFLVERMQVIRARRIPRYRNWMYIVGCVIVVCGFSTVAATSFIWMNSEYVPNTGECFIGLPARVALPLLTYDITINLLLTGVFLYYVKPYLQGGFLAFFLNRTPKPNNIPGGAGRGGQISLPQQKLKRIIRKTFWGCILIMPSTIANMTVLAVMQGHQAGWMCLMFCTLDVLWCTIVIHWLTAPEDEESPIIPATSGPSRPAVAAGAVNVSRSRHRSHYANPHHSAIASYVKPRSSSQTEMDPRGIHREICITQDVETVDITDEENEASTATSITVSTREISQPADELTFSDLK